MNGNGNPKINNKININEDFSAGHISIVLLPMCNKP